MTKNNIKNNNIDESQFQGFYIFLRNIIIPLICFLFFAVNFVEFSRPEIKDKLNLNFILGITAAYSLITLFIISKRWRGLKKFIIDISFYTLFFILFVHFTGGIESHFFPLPLLLLVAAASSVYAASLFIVFGGIFFYYIFSSIDKLQQPGFPIGLFLTNLFFASIISYLCLIMVQRKAQEQKEQVKALRWLNDTQSDFITIASHQLRAPLANIRMTLEGLLEGLNDGLNPPQKEALKNLYLINDNLIIMANNLLDISCLEKGEIILSPKPIDLITFFKEIATQSEALIQTGNQRLIFNEPEEPLPKVNADPNLMDKAVENLLSNAIKYTEKGGEIIVSFQNLPEKGEILTSVKDTGIGIPKSRQERVFQKFFRAENAIKREPGGLGIGLYIVKRVIELNKGRIWFESKEGRGTTFYFTLPAIK